MPATIIDEVKSVLTPALTGAAASALAESPDATGRAITASATEILSSIVQSVRTPSSLQTLFGLIKDAGQEGPRLDDVTSVYQGRLFPTSLGTLSAGLLNTLFGNSIVSVTDRISRASGVGSSAAAWLLGCTSQHVVALLGRELSRSGDVSPAGLLHLIQTRSSNIGDLITNVVPAAAVTHTATSHTGAAAHHTATAATIPRQAPIETATVRPAAAVETRTAAASRELPAATKRDHESSAWLWLLPVLLVGGAGMALWSGTKTVQVEGNLNAEVAKAAVADAVKAAAPKEEAVAAPEPKEAPKEEVQQAAAPAEPAPAAPAEVAPPVEATQTVEVVHGHTDYYGETQGFSREIWVNPDYTAAAPAEAVAVAAAEPAPEPAAAPAELAPPVPGHTDYYGETGTFNAETWIDNSYTFAAAEPPPAPLAEPVPGRTDYYGETGTFKAETWVDTSYTFAAAEPPPVPLVEPVPGHTDYYGETGTFKAETWVDTSYTVAAAEPPPAPLAEPVPGHTDYYGETGTFSRDVWVNQEFTTAAAEPEPAPLAEPVPGHTDYYGETGGFSRDVWVNPDFNKQQAVAQCQDAVNRALGPIRFRVNKAELTAEGRAQLDIMAAAIKTCPSARIRVEGHTDSDGGDTFNQTLSENRAKAVISYLASAGVDTSRMNPLGYGETKPVASNDTPEGKAQNRRIGFVVEGL